MNLQVPTQFVWLIVKEQKIPRILRIKIGRRDRIWTYDPLVPNQLRYQAALLAVRFLNEEKMGWLMGFEPTTTGITIQGSTNWAIATID